ncbi:MAG: hypothetical protein FK733_18140 [Asgard group archaeon]|nr:hypothetical protein [Asgard group archaeon]
MASKKEFIKELEVSTFSKPILKEMGVKAIFLVTFDIILGPIAYINKLTNEKIEYLEFIEDLAHLGEFYTGISHAQIDKVTTRTGEEMIVGRATRKVNETSFIDVAVALVENLEYQEEILKMLKFAVRTSYGNPRNFCELVDKIVLEYQDIAKKRTDTISKSSFKDLSKDKHRDAAKLYANWNGILFVDFERDKLNSSFLPDWIEANKIDPMDIAFKVRDMYAKGIIIPRSKQKFTMVSLKSRQAIIVSTSNLRFSSIVFPTAEGLTRISKIVYEVDILNEALVNVGLEFNGDAMNKTLAMIDKRVLSDKKDQMVNEVVEIMITADVLMPKAIIPTGEYESLEGEFQKKHFKGFVRAYDEFDGTKTIMEIAHKVNTTLDKMADFVVFCKTRGIIQVFTKNGRK